MPLTTQYVKLSIGGRVFCIKDFPDIDPHGEPDQVEITTLCDEFHQYIDGLKNYADNLEFTMNYDEAIFGKLNPKEYDSTSTYNEHDLCIHDGVYYSCKNDSITGTWDSSKWEVATCELLLCSSNVDTTGANGKFIISKIEVSARLSGAGVGDVLEMVAVIKPKSAITFSAVA